MVAETSTAAEQTVDAALRDGYEVHQAALRRGMNVLLLPRQVMMVSTPRGEELSFVHGVPSTSTLSAVTFAQDKRMRRARLVEEGLPVPKGSTFSVGSGIPGARNLINKMGYPVVIKPAMGDNMIEVHADLRDEQAVDEAINYLKTYMDERPTYVKAAYALTLLGDPQLVDGRRTVPRSYRFLVEKQVPGEYLRFLIVDDGVVSAVHSPRGPRRPEANRDITGSVHPSLSSMAFAASRALPGLAVAAVDIVVTDPFRDVADQDAWIVELSERPWLAAQAAISDSLSGALGEAILLSHATGSSVTVPEARDTETAALDVRIEGLTQAADAVVAFEQHARRREITTTLTVTDPVEGVVEGVLEGTASEIALVSELLLDGRVEGHKAMLIATNARHRIS